MSKTEHNPENAAAGLRPALEVRCSFDHATYYRTQTEIPLHFSAEARLSSEKTISVGFTLYQDDLRNVVPRLPGPYHTVFHDAFSPQKMPELWSVDLFRHYHRLLAPCEGTVITYSAAAAVRGGLLEAGFSIVKTRPLGEKSGGSLAYTTHRSVCTAPYTDSDNIMPLNEIEQAYLKSRAGIPYRDPDLNQSRQLIVSNRKVEQSTSSRSSGARLRALLRGD